MEHVWQLITRKITGEATPQERYELLQLQYRRPELRYYMYFLSEWWSMAEKQGKEEAEKAFNKVLLQLETSNQYLLEAQRRKNARGFFIKWFSWIMNAAKYIFRMRN